MRQDETAESYVARPVGYIRPGYRGPGDVRHVARGWTKDASRVELLPGRGSMLAGL